MVSDLSVVLLVILLVMSQDLTFFRKFCIHVKNFLTINTFQSNVSDLSSVQENLTVSHEMFPEFIVDYY